jgi:hypothetical protein
VNLTQTKRRSKQLQQKIRDHVESLFTTAPRTRRAFELKDELVANLCDRYNDLVAKGRREDEAFEVVIAGIGDVDELIRPLRERDAADPGKIQAQRQKSAMLVSVAVAIYILSFIFPFIGSRFGDAAWVAGIVIMFISWAAATMLIVYNAVSKPKYEKSEDSIVEEFKEWSVVRGNEKTVLKSVVSLIWSVTTMLYLVMGFFFGMWHPGWMIFPLAGVVTHIVTIVYSMRGSKH